MLINLQKYHADWAGAIQSSNSLLLRKLAVRKPKDLLDSREESFDQSSVFSRQ